MGAYLVGIAKHLGLELFHDEFPKVQGESIVYEGIANVWMSYLLGLTQDDMTLFEEGITRSSLEAGYKFFCVVSLIE